MRSHGSIAIREFNGLFDRGREDSVPLDHWTSAQNMEFSQNGYGTRRGVVLTHTIQNLRRMHVYKRTGEAPRLILLNSAGQFFDSLDLVTPILTVATATDFAMVSMYNRAYISPHNGERGLPGEFVYVYQGSGTARKAGGTGPGGLQLTANDGPAGKVEKGLRLLAFAYETDTGFRTQIGAVREYNGPGAKKITLTDVGTGPSGTVARHTLSTKLIPDSPGYNGNPKDYEFFFIPDGKIEGNLNTGPLDVDYFDTDLLESADFLIDELTEIPAMVFLMEFNGRMIGGGENTKEAVMRASKLDEPESFSGTEGYRPINPGDAGGPLTNAAPHRGNLYLYKNFRTYMTQDNGEEPSTWPVTLIDGGIGTTCHGAATVLDQEGLHQDRIVLASRGGLEVFTGTFPDKPLTWKVEDIWRRINPTAFETIEVAINPVKKTIYCALPLDAETKPNIILYGDYSDGLDPDNVSWCPWVFPWSPQSVVVDVDPFTNEPFLRIARYSANVYDQTEVRNDAGTSIEAWAETAFVTTDEEAMVSHFTGIVPRVVGAGSLQVHLRSEDGAFSSQVHDIGLSTAPGGVAPHLFDFSAHRAAVKLRVNLFDEWFELNRLDILSKPALYDIPA